MGGHGEGLQGGQWDGERPVPWVKGLHSGWWGMEWWEATGKVLQDMQLGGEWSMARGEATGLWSGKRGGDCWEAGSTGLQGDHMGGPRFVARGRSLHGGQWVADW